MQHDAPTNAQQQNISDQPDTEQRNGIALQYQRLPTSSTLTDCTYLRLLAPLQLDILELQPDSKVSTLQEALHWLSQSLQTQPQLVSFSAQTSSEQTLLKQRLHVANATPTSSPQRYNKGASSVYRDPYTPDYVCRIELASAHRALVIHLPVTPRPDYMSPIIAVLALHEVCKFGLEVWRSVLSLLQYYPDAVCNNVVNISTPAQSQASHFGENLRMLIHTSNQTTQQAGGVYKALAAPIVDTLWYGLHAHAHHAVGLINAKLISTFSTGPIANDATVPQLYKCLASMYAIAVSMRPDPSKQLKVSYDSVVLTEQQVIVQMNQYDNRVRLRSTVTINYTDGCSEYVEVQKVQGKTAFLQRVPQSASAVTPTVGGDEAMAVVRTAAEVERITLSREHEADMLNNACIEYIRAIALKPLQLLQPPALTASHVFAQFVLHVPASSQVQAALADVDLTYQPSTPGVRHLNPSQQRAACLCLKSPIALLTGPAGTGKTQTIAAVVSELVATGHRVVCTAHTNQACRQMCQALSQQLDSSKVGLVVSDEFFVQWHESQYPALLAEGYKTNLATAAMRPVICATLGSLFAPRSTTMLQDRTVLIFDEASQVFDGHFLTLLMRYSSITKLCIFGDVKQLPPYSPSQTLQPSSALQTLQQLPLLRSVCTTLDTQYRMNKRLGTMISLLFYNGHLRNAPNDAADDSDSIAKLTAAGVEWVDVKGSYQVSGTSTYNVQEADKCVELFRQAVAAGVDPSAIAIVTFYEAQRKHLMDRRVPGLIASNVDSVQGAEAEVVILTLASNKPSAFLRSLHRCNVALSRARKMLYIVGHRSALCASTRNNIYYAISSYIDMTAEQKKQTGTYDLTQPQQIAFCKSYAQYTC